MPKTLLRSVCDALQTPAVSIASLRTFYTHRQTLYEHQLGPAPTWAFKISMNWFTSDQGLLAVVGQNLLLGTLIVAAVIFVETGLVVMPFLPGESRRNGAIGAGHTVVADSASPENALEVFAARPPRAGATPGPCGSMPTKYQNRVRSAERKRVRNHCACRYVVACGVRHIVQITFGVGVLEVNGGQRYGVTHGQQ